VTSTRIPRSLEKALEGRPRLVGHRQIALALEALESLLNLPGRLFVSTGQLKDLGEVQERHALGGEHVGALTVFQRFPREPGSFLELPSSTVTTLRCSRLAGASAKGAPQWGQKAKSSALSRRQLAQVGIGRG